MQRQQEGDISKSYIKVPELPIDKVRCAFSRSRKQKVPWMSIAMHDCQRSAFK
jgi:hypothetical protein